MPAAVSPRACRPRSCVQISMGFSPAFLGERGGDHLQRLRERAHAIRLHALRAGPSGFQGLRTGAAGTRNSMCLRERAHAVRLHALRAGQGGRGLRILGFAERRSKAFTAFRCLRKCAHALRIKVMNSSCGEMICPRSTFGVAGSRICGVEGAWGVRPHLRPAPQRFTSACRCPTPHLCTGMHRYTACAPATQAARTGSAPVRAAQGLQALPRASVKRGALPNR